MIGGWVVTWGRAGAGAWVRVGDEAGVWVWARSGGGVGTWTGTGSGDFMMEPVLHGWSHLWVGAELADSPCRNVRCWEEIFLDGNASSTVVTLSRMTNNLVSFDANRPRKKAIAQTCEHLCRWFLSTPRCAILSCHPHDVARMRRGGFFGPRERGRKRRGYWSSTLEEWRTWGGGDNKRRT